MGRKKKPQAKQPEALEPLGDAPVAEELPAATPLAEEAERPLEAVIEPAAFLPVKRTYEVVEDRTITIGMHVTKIRKGKQVICDENDPYLIELLRQRVILREVV
jgi:hypothetical protein